MTRSELIRLIADDGHLPDAVATRVVHVFFSELGTRLEGGGRVELRGFGSFDVRTLPPRTVRNPKNGATFEKGEVQLPRFRMSRTLMETLNPTLQKKRGRT